MNKIVYKILIIAIAFIAYSCDTIEGDYLENPDDLQSTVTVFEFTGIGCVNCPEKGHEVIAKYQESFGDKLQVVSIHGNEFGKPIDGFLLRTTEGQELAEQVEVEGLPKGSANTLFAGSSKVPNDLGGDIVEAGLKYPDLELNVDFSVEDSVATVTINGIFKPTLSKAYGTLNIGVYLLQSDIEGPQKDLRGDHEEYHHKHAFRKPFTAITGNLLTENPFGGMVIDNLTFDLDLNLANIVLSEGQSINDLNLEPLVFVLESTNYELIPCLIKYN